MNCSMQEKDNYNKEIYEDTALFPKLFLNLLGNIFASFKADTVRETSFLGLENREKLM